MKKSPLAAALAGLTMFATTATALPVHIDPGAYTGRYKVQGSEFTSGPSDYDLAPGDYSVELGASIGGSSFLFTVGPTGDVMTTSPTAAASGLGSTLTFNTVDITIDSVNYTGRYFVSSFSPTELHGLQTFKLVPEIAYSLDTGANVAGSAFAFAIDAFGNVVASTPAATASAATLTFRNVNVTINPASYAGRYYLSTAWPAPFIGRQTSVFVPGLVYGLDNGSAIGGSECYFTVDAAGSVSNVQVIAGTGPAAVGVGATLTLLNVPVHVDPTTYAGSYRVAAYQGLSGPTDLILIPNLVTAVNTTSAGAQIVPELANVTPPSVLTFIFTVSQQGIAQGLIAQIAAFKASGDIAGPAATSLSAQINAAGGLASVNPAAAQHLLSVISNRLVSLASRGQVSAAARDTLILQITLWSAAL